MVLGRIEYLSIFRGVVSTTDPRHLEDVGGLIILYQFILFLKLTIDLSPLRLCSIAIFIKSAKKAQHLTESGS